MTNGKSAHGRAPKADDGAEGDAPRPKAPTPYAEVARSKTAPLKFSDAYLKTLRPPSGKREFVQFEACGSGLGVRASASGRVGFIVQLKLKGGGRWRETLGPWGKLTVKQARALVQKRAFDDEAGVDLAKQLADEITKARMSAKARKFTLRALLDRWRDEHLAGQRPSYAVRAYGNVTRVFAALLDKPAGAITKPEVRDAVARVRGEGKRAVARLAAAALLSALRWSVSQDLLQASPIEGLTLPPREPPRERVLDPGEARRIYRAAAQLGYPGGPFVRLLMLTAARRAEIAALEWTEIKDGGGADAGDEGGGFAVELPSARTKTGAPHRVPLSAAALDVIEDCKRHRVLGCKFVFSSDARRGFNNFARVKARLDRALANDGGPAMESWTLHDFRRSAVTTLAAMGHDPTVIDLLLGHQPTKLSAIARVYQKFDHGPARAKALADWAEHLTRPGAEVVALGARAR
jgi:integrase